MFTKFPAVVLGSFSNSADAATSLQPSVTTSTSFSVGVLECMRIESATH